MHSVWVVIVYVRLPLNPPLISTNMSDETLRVGCHVVVDYDVSFYHRSVSGLGVFGSFPGSFPLPRINKST